MKKLIFATNNKHKVEEVRAALGGMVQIVTLAEAGLSGEIPETADTLQGNALQKAQWVWERTGMDCFADELVIDMPSTSAMALRCASATATSWALATVTTSL